jgi:peroxiredoxin
MASLPAIGSTAPDFTLPSTAGAAVTLSSLRGKNVLLAFFPAAFTSVCATEMCAFSEDYSQFEGSNTVVLPISVDAVPSLKAFRAQHQMKLDLLSDFKRDVSRLYGALNEERFSSIRAYILIDRNGIVRWAHAEETPASRRENAEIIEQITQLN